MERSRQSQYLCPPAARLPAPNPLTPSPLTPSLLALSLLTPNPLAPSVRVSHPPARRCAPPGVAGRPGRPERRSSGRKLYLEKLGFLVLEQLVHLSDIDMREVV